MTFIYRPEKESGVQHSQNKVSKGAHEDKRMAITARSSAEKFELLIVLERYKKTCIFIFEEM